MNNFKSEGGDPFIIWTFRRTGGTNLGQALFSSSPYSAVEHEPFNSDRVFGDVTNRFKNTLDIDRLRKDVDLILKSRPLIKHCLEIMPRELNLILAELSVKYGYKSIFLYREYAKDRLLSLNYAQKTSVWGSKHKKRLHQKKDVFKAHFPVESMIRHEYMCRNKMSEVFDFLFAKGANPIAISFESLYQHNNYDYSCLLVCDLIKKLGISENVASNDFLEKILKRGGQGTKNDYLKFPRSHEFVLEVDKLPKYSVVPEKKINVKIFSENVDFIYARCWPVLNGLVAGEYYAPGVLLVSNEKSSLAFSVSGQPVKGVFKLSSPRIKNMFPDSLESGSCRFIIGPVSGSDDIEIMVKSDCDVYRQIL